jgi:hypothetical protein
MNKRGLRVPRIDGHSHEQSLIEGSCGFAEAEDLVILRRVRPKIRVFSKRTVFAPNFIQPREVVFDIPWGIPIATLELVFF